MNPRPLVLDEDALVHLWLRDLAVSADPSGATVELEVTPFAARFSAVWQDAGSASGDTWTRAARTADLFGGSATTTGITLSAGTHRAKWVLTYPDGQVVTTPNTSIYVH